MNTESNQILSSKNKNQTERRSRDSTSSLFTHKAVGYGGSTNAVSRTKHNYCLVLPNCSSPGMTRGLCTVKKGTECDFTFISVCLSAGIKPTTVNSPVNLQLTSVSTSCGHVETMRPASFPEENRFSENLVSPRALPVSRIDQIWIIILLGRQVPNPRACLGGGDISRPENRKIWFPFKNSLAWKSAQLFTP